MLHVVNKTASINPFLGQNMHTRLKLKVTFEYLNVPFCPHSGSSQIFPLCGGRTTFVVAIFVGGCFSCQSVFGNKYILVKNNYYQTKCMRHFNLVLSSNVISPLIQSLVSNSFVETFTYKCIMFQYWTRPLKA